MAAVNAYGAVSLALLLLICATSVSPAASGQPYCTVHPNRVVGSAVSCDDMLELFMCA